MTETLSNARYATLNDYLKASRKLGSAEQQGALSRAEWAIETAIAASEGVLSSGDAAEAWGAFRESTLKKNGELVRDVEKSAKTRVSETVQIIKAGSMPNVDFASVLTNARAYIATAAGDEVKGNTWDNFIKLARGQLKSATKTLTPDEVVAILRPEPSKEKDELLILKSMVKTMEKTRDGTEDTETTIGKPAYPSAELDVAIDAINQRIAYLELSALHAKVAAATAATSVLIPKV